MKTTPDIIEFVTDDQLLGLSLSVAQEVLLRGFYGLPLLNDQQRELWVRGTERSRYPESPFEEATIVAGARSGKDSRICAPIACYESVFGDHARHLGRGELGMIPVVAQDARGARIAFSYIKDYLQRSKLLASMLDNVLASEITLRNRISIATYPCTVRSLRGWSVCTGIMDELGHWRLEGSVDADVEIQQSILRGMVGFPHPKLVKVSTPFWKSGILHQDFVEHFGVDTPDCLVWRADTRTMNPSISAERLDRERRRDPLRYEREYLAQFVDALSQALPPDWVDQAVMRGRFEIAPDPGCRYTASCDPSGGGPASFTFAIVHVEGQGDGRRLVQDVMRGWSRMGSDAPDLTGIVRDIATTLKHYRLSEITGDKYGGQWIAQAFRDVGITYCAAVMDASQAYVEAQPLFARGAIAILDHPGLIRELKNLEQSKLPSGKVKIDAPKRQNDDFANALVLAAVLALSEEPLRLLGSGGLSVDDLQRIEAERLMAQAKAGAERIEQAVRATGCWFPSDG